MLCLIKLSSVSEYFRPISGQAAGSVCVYVCTHKYVCACRYGKRGGGNSREMERGKERTKDRGKERLHRNFWWDLPGFVNSLLNMSPQEVLTALMTLILCHPHPGLPEHSPVKILNYAAQAEGFSGGR